MCIRDRPTVVKQGSLEGWQLVSQGAGAAGDRGFTLWSSGDFMLDAQKPAMSLTPITLNAAADNGRNWLELRQPAGGPPQSVAIERSIETIVGARYVLSLDLAGYPLSLIHISFGMCRCAGMASHGNRRRQATIRLPFSFLA